MATTIALVRHGETDWNRERRVQGHTDTPLNETGRRQAAALAATLAGEPIAAVYTSDLARARDTASVLAEQRGLEVRSDPRLREKHFGTWEGLHDHEVLERFPEAATGPWGDGETTAEMEERVLLALGEIASQHPDEQVLVVTHGGPLRAVLRQCAVEGLEQIANCHVARIAVRDEKLEQVD